MKTAVLTILACASIASAGAATVKVLSTGTGQTAALITSTEVGANDSPLVRAAKLTVASRNHSGATTPITDAMVAHPMRVLGVSAPGSPAPAGSPSVTAPSGATPMASSARATAPSNAPVPGPQAVQPYGPSGPPSPMPAQRH